MNKNMHQSLLAHIQDMIQSDRVQFSDFLDEGLVRFVEKAIQEQTMPGCLLYGGHPNCSRKMLGTFPEHITPSEQLFPIEPLTVYFPSNYALTHRDVLGSLISLGLKRDSIGDIFVSDCSSTVFVRKSVAPLICQEWNRIGKAKITVRNELDDSNCMMQKYDLIEGTVSSMRLDSIVALATGISRKKASAAIQSGMVKVCGMEIISPKATIKVQDIVSIRGYGKYIIDSIPRTTKKQRLFIKILKYK